MEVMEDAVDPLSQSLSVFRLAFRLRPGNDSTDSPLATDSRENKVLKCHTENTQIKKKLTTTHTFGLLTVGSLALQG